MSGAPNPLAVVQLLLAQYHAATVAPLAAQLKDARERIQQLESEAALRKAAAGRPCGPYTPGAEYMAGDQVMRAGSTWRALVDDPAGPPPGEGWMLIAAGRRALKRAL